MKNQPYRRSYEVEDDEGTYSRKLVHIPCTEWKENFSRDDKLDEERRRCYQKETNDNEEVINDVVVRRSTRTVRLSERY